MTARTTNPCLTEKERVIEEWRTGRITEIFKDRVSAIYGLALMMSIETHSAVRRAMESDTEPSVVERIIRQYVFALQFGLEAVEKANLPNPLYAIQEVPNIHYDEETIYQIHEYIAFLWSYVDVRDLYIGYYRDVYDVVECDDRHVTMKDRDGWDGEYDYAQHLLNNETRANRAQAGSGHLSYDVLSEYPMGLDMGGITSDQYLSLWNKTMAVCSEYAMRPVFPILEKSDLINRINSDTDSNKEIATRFLEFITYSGKQKAKLSLFHTPYIPLGEDGGIVFVWALYSSNLATTSMRVAIERGIGIDAYSKQYETYLLNRIVNVYQGINGLFALQKDYVDDSVSGEVDMAYYSATTNALYLVQAKCFVPPDTTPEVLQANESIIEAVEQTARMRRWCESITHKEIGEALGLDTINDQTIVHYVVLGNGFVGSDYVPHPDWILFADIKHLLRLEPRQIDFENELITYDRNLREVAENVVSTVEIAEIKILQYVYKSPSTVCEVR